MSNVRKIFQMAIKYNNIYHSEALQNLPKFGIFGLKTNHLATLLILFRHLSLKQRRKTVECWSGSVCWIRGLALGSLES
jgi:hypothetical protein